MSGTPGDTGVKPPSRVPGTSPRARYKPIVAAGALASPLLLLAVANAAVLAVAFADPSSTCWLGAQIEAGRRVVFPFEIHLLYFAATAQAWGPILLLAAVLFWYLDWIRVRELLVAALLAGFVLYFVGFEYGWLADLYRGRFDAACG